LPLLRNFVDVAALLASEALETGRFGFLQACFIDASCPLPAGADSLAGSVVPDAA
jgi:hypothetical protein